MKQRHVIGAPTESGRGELPGQSPEIAAAIDERLSRLMFSRGVSATDDYQRHMHLGGFDYCEHNNVRRWCPQCNPETSREARTFPTVRGLDNALKLWRGGFDSWRNVPRAEQRAEYESVILAIKERLNDCPNIAALVNRYYQVNDWCLNIAKRLYPEKPYTWRLSIVEDAAYWLRLLELDAVDTHRAGLGGGAPVVDRGDSRG